jgi:hypothetical protein
MVVTHMFTFCHIFGAAIFPAAKVTGRSFGPCRDPSGSAAVSTSDALKDTRIKVEWTQGNQQGRRVKQLP